MIAPDESPNDYPLEWGYRPAAKGALEAAFDVYAASLTDTEFKELVARTRDGEGK